MLVIGPAHLNAATAIAGKWQGSGSWQATLFAPFVNSQETLRRQLWSITSGRTGEIKRCSGMSRTGSHFAKGVTIRRHDSKNSALNIGTNHYANMPATQGGGRVKSLPAYGPRPPPPFARIFAESIGWGESISSGIVARRPCKYMAFARFILCEKIWRREIETKGVF